VKHQYTSPLLIVEDNPEDFASILRTVRKAGYDNPVTQCADGDEALDYLYHRGKFSDPSSAPRPCFILLDLNLPGTDGRDVLAEIKRDPGLSTIPVVIFTSSTEHRDVLQCYRAGANAYIQKPHELARYLATVTLLAQHWLGMVVSA
jgi:CheY-like chemotaxis protein